MDDVHSSSSSPRVARPEGIPDGLIPPGTGNPVSEGSQYICLQHNIQILQSAAAATGNPVPAVLQTQPMEGVTGIPVPPEVLQIQSAAAVTGNPVPAVMQTQPMEGVTGTPVPPEMFQIQPDPETFSSAGSDSESAYYSKGDAIYCHDIREVKKKQRHKRNSSKVSGTDSSAEVATMKAPQKPLLKADVPKTSRTFLWNSGGKKVQVPKDLSPPKQMVIEGVTIYIQLLTSEEAKNCGIMGWDSVLADSKRFRPEIAERKIAEFWANWRHNRVMARRYKTQKHSNPTPGPSAEADGSTTTTTQSKDTPSVDASKRKRTGTPGSAEPPSKKSLTTGESYSRVAGADPTPKSTIQTLWVHTHDVDRGPIEKDIFFEIVSRCNVIKNQGAIKGESEFCWKSNLKRQPTFDAENSRGKIVCGNQQTVDFWVKYIPIAALDVCDLNCKAWTWKEYEIPKIRYSFLVPFDTCSGLDARDLVHGALAINNLSMSDVLTCRTSYAKLTHQRICKWGVYMNM